MDVESLTAAAVYLFTAFNYFVNVYKKRVIKKKWQKRRRWMLSIHRNRTRSSMDKQLAELLAEPSGEFDNFVRMSFSDFEYLLQKISPIVAKHDTNWRDAIPVKIRLAVTLRYLATGDCYKSLHHTFKISSQVISKIIQEVCSTLNIVLKDFVKIPTSEDEWFSKSEGFRFPNCVGALDGKHIMILPPPFTGSEYFNYKGHFSIVLLALVDSDYCFMCVDIGCPGRISDGGVYNQSVLRQKIETNGINLPPPNRNNNLPYVFLADSAFALSTCIMKPFPGHHAVGTPERIFNQELSRSRVVVENAFGILSSKFRIFKTCIPLDEVKAAKITMTCILLHNFLRRSNTSRNLYTPTGTTDSYVNGELVRGGSWRSTDRGTGITPLNGVPRRSKVSAPETKVNFMNHIIERRNNSQAQIA